MLKIEKKDNCCGCYACYSVCHKKSIEFLEDEDGFKYPSINKQICTNCNSCNKVCPLLEESHTNKDNYPQAYAGINLSHDVRMNSSSGGIFSLLAEEILKNNGVVFGARFDSQFNVVHAYFESIKELEKFRGSKYVQSDIGDSYINAKEFLEQGRKVLFTGTPCQISGLKSFLKKDFENLYTQDIICFGVPSPKVWRKYLDYREANDLKKPEQITFRDKQKSWKKFSVKFEYDNGKYEENKLDDLYMRFFIAGLSLRKSCYNCSFKLQNKIADITLGDFWGIENVLPEWDDDKGVSAIIVNNEKGKKMLEAISSKLKLRDVEINDIIKYNPMLVKASDLNKNREKFFADLDKKDFDELASKYLKKPSVLRKIASRIKRSLLKK